PACNSSKRWAAAGRIPAYLNWPPVDGENAPSLMLNPHRSKQTKNNITSIMKNKTILITGGTTGIGLATAKLLSTDGAKVIVTGRNPETLAAAQRELPGVIVIKSDSGSLSAAQLLGIEVKKHVGDLDGVFLNAGIA